jgi:hypothetical protein
MTIKAALGLLAALPLAANADPIFVDYQGTVSDIIGALPSNATTRYDESDHYAIGAPVVGRLTIHPDLAGPPISYNAGATLYGWGLQGNHDFVPDFVTGFLSRGPGNDTLSTDPYSDGYYDVGDKRVVDTTPNVVFSGIHITARVAGLLEDYGEPLEQFFDVTAADLRHSADYLRAIIYDGSRNVYVALSHLSVKPGRCSAAT